MLHAHERVDDAPGDEQPQAQSQCDAEAQKDDHAQPTGAVAGLCRIGGLLGVSTLHRLDPGQLRNQFLHDRLDFVVPDSLPGGKVVLLPEWKQFGLEDLGVGGEVGLNGVDHRRLRRGGTLSICVQRYLEPLELNG
jgi:hypothetical protein